MVEIVEAKLTHHDVELTLSDGRVVRLNPVSLNDKTLYLHVSIAGLRDDKLSVRQTAANTLEIRFQHPTS